MTTMDDLKYVRHPIALPRIEANTREVQFGMASEPLLGALLRVLAASKPAGRILELGTGTGFATTWLLDGMDAEARLISVDVNASLQGLAGQVLAQDKRLMLVTEDAAHFLQKQPPQSFDLVFADAMPGKYEGLDDALTAVKIGGFYVIDDLLPQPNWPDGHAGKVPVLLNRLASRPDFVIVPISWASGIVIAVRVQ